MKLEIFQVDAFTDRLFGGNPACVVPLQEWLPDQLLLNIANENAVPETAFIIKAEDHFYLRWFTPEIEMDLCGHATLASAHVLKTMMNYAGDKIMFHSKSGNLEVTTGDKLYTLNFPSRMPVAAELPLIIRNALDRQPTEVLKSRDYMLVYETEKDIVDIRINRQMIDQINLDPGGIIITAKGDNSDFVSRFFTPQASVFEDPVTGSAHCSLIPYWSNRLKKKELTALQLSQRKGKIGCLDKGDRVFISGEARTYSHGYIFTGE